MTPLGCSDSFILSLAIACRKYEQLTMPFIEKPSSAARRGTESTSSVVKTAVFVVLNLLHLHLL